MNRVKTIGVHIIWETRGATNTVLVKEACDTHVNCKNENCNLLFLQCPICQRKHNNCCSTECIEIASLPEEERLQLRKGVENKKMYYSHKRVNLNLKESE